MPHRLAVTAVAFAVAGLLAGCAPGGTSAGSSGSNGSSSSADAAAAATSLSEVAGSISGGTEVTISGTGLSGVTAVSFGDNPATAVSATDNSVTVTTPAATDYAEGEVAVTLAAGDAAVAASALTFDYDAETDIDHQMAYLMKYYKNYNTEEYGELPDTDCVNFTSQSLIARGWEMTDEWYQNNVTNYSKAWISSTAMMNYFADRPELATALDDDQRDEVAIGDIVQFDWDNSGDRDHTGVVTRIEGSGDDIKIYFAGHTTDSNFRDVDKAITVDHPGGTAYYWHLEK
jgi:hypothetical protein